MRLKKRGFWVKRRAEGEWRKEVLFMAEKGKKVASSLLRENRAIVVRALKVRPFCPVPSLHRLESSARRFGSLTGFFLYPKICLTSPFPKEEEPPIPSPFSLVFLVPLRSLLLLPPPPSLRKISIFKRVFSSILPFSLYFSYDSPSPQRTSPGRGER